MLTRKAAPNAELSQDMHRAAQVNFAYDKCTMKSIRKNGKMIAWVLICALALSVGAGLVSGVV